MKCINECFEKGEMSSSQKQAIITLIEKKGKDRSFLENWRPISLVNADTKIMTKAMASRIKNVLPDIIHTINMHLTFDILTKYFLSLESHQKAKSCVRKVFTKKGTLSSDPKIIMTELEDFYTDLYDSEGNLPDCANLFLRHSEIPQLSPEKAATCEGKLTVEECLQSHQITWQWWTYGRIL